MWKYIYEIHDVQQISIVAIWTVEPMLCYIVLGTNESPMLRGRGEARLEEVVRETGRCERGGGRKGKILVIVPSAFQTYF